MDIVNISIPEGARDIVNRNGTLLAEELGNCLDVSLRMVEEGPIIELNIGEKFQFFLSSLKAERLAIALLYAEQRLVQLFEKDRRITPEKHKGIPSLKAVLDMHVSVRWVGLEGGREVNALVVILKKPNEKGKFDKIAFAEGLPKKGLIPTLAGSLMLCANISKSMSKEKGTQ